MLRLFICLFIISGGISVRRTGRTSCPQLHSANRSIVAILAQVIHMVGSFPVSANHIARAPALDTGFETRWDAWLARGRAHEQRVRRRFIVCAGAIATGAAIVYALLR